MFCPAPLLSTGDNSSVSWRVKNWVLSKKAAGSIIVMGITHSFHLITSASKVDTLLETISHSLKTDDHIRLERSRRNQEWNSSMSVSLSILMSIRIILWQCDSLTLLDSSRPTSRCSGQRLAPLLGSTACGNDTTSNYVFYLAYSGTFPSSESATFCCNGNARIPQKFMFANTDINPYWHCGTCFICAKQVKKAG